jgi:hypothetical protein
MSGYNTVVVEVPMTMRISVQFPAGAPRAAGAAAELAEWAAQRLAHVSHSQIDACNELNRLFPHHPGVVAEVEGRVVAPAAKAA